MSLTEKHEISLLERGFSRRSLGRIAGMVAAGGAAPFFSEHALAQQAERRMMRGPTPAGAVRISSNENPLGPSKEGLEALYKVAPHGGRYSPFNETPEMAKAIAEVEGVKEDYVMPTAGSSDPLMRSACAFTSPTRSWVMADPGYGGGAPDYIGSKVVRVPLRADFSHDVEAMIKADPDAGAYYVCNPNNPTGTITARKDIEYLLAYKKNDAVVVVDEAYIHFSGSAQPASDLVAADKDVVILRTFSKLYGMAGIRSGCAIGRPDLLAKMNRYGGGRVPITAAACTTASVRAKSLIADRRAINKQIREDTLEFLEKKKFQYIPSETSFFLIEVNRPGGEVAQMMAKEKVIIGRTWPVWPTKVRVSVGTQEEMDKFKAAFDKVMS